MVQREARGGDQSFQESGTIVTPYDLEFLESAEKEFLSLSASLPRLFREKLFYLLRNPYKSYPWLRVRQGAHHPGEWRFHLGQYRVLPSGGIERSPGLR